MKKVRRVGVAGVAVRPPHGLSHRDGHSTDVAKPTLQTSPHTAPTLPNELVEEILLRVPPDEPAHLVCATLVCKAWHSILSDDTFRRRYRLFHGTPTLQGYFYNDFESSTMRFVPTTSTAVSGFCVSKVYNSKAFVLDCRHGRVLIHQAGDCLGSRDLRLIVWDPITGSQQHLSSPTYPQYPYYYNYYVAAVLCAKSDCDHLDCHGGPFLVVFVVSSHYCDGEGLVQTWASVYSSETGAWSASMTPNVKTRKCLADTSLLIGDALYFNTEPSGHSIVKYDLCKHELSVIHLPGEFEPVLIKGNDGGLGLATLLHDCIYTWSWQVDSSGDGGSFKYRVLKLEDTLLPKGDHDSTYLICMAEGTNTVFIRVKGEGLFTLDLKSRQVREIGEEKTYSGVIFPYTSFHTTKY